MSSEYRDFPKDLEDYASESEEFTLSGGQKQRVINCKSYALTLLTQLQNLLILDVLLSQWHEDWE